MTDALDTHLLAIYLNDHVAGATVGVQRVRRMARAYDGTVVGTAITPLVSQLEEERQWLLRCLELVGIPLRRYKVVGAAIAERAGRLKLNGHVRSASPLSALLEVELLRGAITGKSSGWQTLRAQSSRLGLTAEHEGDLDGLVVQADEQFRVLSGLLDVLHAHVFERGGSTTS
ncbi:hypothetical protein ACFWGN_21100 [Oerskovia sp. NPDC060338]|jgi:hypothetical protein|uniref:hypothetical protein n=1 Tax=Oerskovia sp. NPDC060338 TaxID=3347100 RepID=UPI003665202F